MSRKELLFVVGLFLALVAALIFLCAHSSEANELYVIPTTQYDGTVLTTFTDELNELCLLPPDSSYVINDSAYAYVATMWREDPWPTHNAASTFQNRRVLLSFFDSMLIGKEIDSAQVVIVCQDTVMWDYGSASAAFWGDPTIIMHLLFDFRKSPDCGDMIITVADTTCWQAADTSISYAVFGAGDSLRLYLQPLDVAIGGFTDILIKSSVEARLCAGFPVASDYDYVSFWMSEAPVAANRPRLYVWAHDATTEPTACTNIIGRRSGRSELTTLQ